MEETLQAFIILLEWNENVHFFTMYEITFLVGGPWKSNVVLEKSLKNGCNYLYEPCSMYSPWLKILNHFSIITHKHIWTFKS